MRCSVKIARGAGTEMCLHNTFLLFLGWIVFAYSHAGSPEAAPRGVVFITLLFWSVVLHELGHVVAARQFGIQTPDIALLPSGGVARLRRMPTEPLQETAVAFACAPFADAIKALLRTSQHEFPVVDGAGRVLGMLTRDDMIRALQTLGPDTRVVDVMRHDVPVGAQNAKNMSELMMNGGPRLANPALAHSGGAAASQRSAGLTALAVSSR